MLGCNGKFAVGQYMDARALEKIIHNATVVVQWLLEVLQSMFPILVRKKYMIFFLFNICGQI